MVHSIMRAISALSLEPKPRFFDSAEYAYIKICRVPALMAFKQFLLLVFLGLPILCCSTCTIVVFQCIYHSIFISICRYLQRDYIKIQLAAVYFLLSAGWFRQAAFPVEPNNQSKSWEEEYTIISKNKQPIDELRGSTKISITTFFQKVEPNNQSKR